MQHPWSLEDDDIPPAQAEQSQTRRLRVVGIGLWGLVISSLVVVMVSDTGALSAAQVALLGLLALGGAVLTLFVGLILARVISTYGFAARLLFGIGLTLAVFALLPILVSFVLEHVPVFEDIPIDRDRPLATLLELLFE